MKNKKIFIEKEIKDLAKQILSALAHSHSLNFAHRDVKADNIMYANQSSESPIKLIDFGFATRFKSKNEFNELMGSPLYMAPEVVSGKNYNEKCDIWSCGIVIYFLICGKFPYKSFSSAKLLFKEISEYQFVFNNLKEFKHFSEKGKSFLLRALNSDQNKRPSANELLLDPWFSSEEIGSELNSKDKIEILDSIQKYKVSFNLEL